MADYDAIILGAGHNGLILQAYLGKAGLRTLSIDRAATAGGGLATVEDPRHPGFLHNTHAFFQRAVTAMPWYADLDLQRLGAEYIEPELNVALITRDHDALEWWTDIERTARSFARFSEKDARTLRRWHADFVPIVQKFLAPEAKAPPLPPQERQRQGTEEQTAGEVETSKQQHDLLPRPRAWPIAAPSISQQSTGEQGRAFHGGDGLPYTARCA